MPLSKAALSRPLAWADQVAWGWFMVDGLTHLTLELSYLYFAFQMGGQTAAQSDSPAAFTWREYGKADVRWSGSDPGIMALELITVFGSGPLCLLCAWAIKERKAWRHILQASICVAELYGGWMTFVPEWVVGSPNLRTHHPIFTWLYLFFFNGVWVLIPIVLLVESWLQITAACDKAKTEGTDGHAVSPFWYNVCAGTGALYSVLVPATLGFASYYDIK